MKLDPKQIGLWIGLPTVILVGILSFGEKWDGFQEKQVLLAQEAAAERAEEVVNARMEPVVSQLELVNESLRRQEDRELLDRCEERAEKRGEDPLDYEPRCIKESNLRWRWWDFDDCRAAGRSDCEVPEEERP